VLSSATEIRPATEADLAAMLEIYAGHVLGGVATFEVEPPDPAEWARRFRSVLDAGLPFLAAESGGRVAGYAYCRPWNTRPAYRQTVEDTIYLADWATGQGIGGALLGELLAACEKADIREVLGIVVDSGNPASLLLHRKHGFEETGRLRRVGFKHGRWLDTVILQRSLSFKDENSRDLPGSA
jgi:L-amino acid N-acyltransferase YncA